MGADKETEGPQRRGCLSAASLFSMLYCLPLNLLTNLKILNFKSDVSDKLNCLSLFYSNFVYSGSNVEELEVCSFNKSHLIPFVGNTENKRKTYVGA